MRSAGVNTAEVPGIVEKVLEANPSLAAHGTFLPMGTKVILPDIETPEQIKQTIQLWD